MEKFYIETHGAGVCYESDIELQSFFNKGNFLQIPGITISQKVPDDCDKYVKYVASKENKFYCDGNNMIIKYDPELITQSSIIRVGFLLLEKGLAEKKKVLVHSACVSKKNNSILFLGRSGSGKTSTVLNLCRNYGYRLVGNDRVIIGLNSDDKLFSYSGTDFINMRYGSVIKNTPELINHFDHFEGDPWSNKKSTHSSNLNIKVEKRALEIAKGYLLHIDSEQKHFYHSLASEPVHKLFLNEIFTMGIRGIYSTFYDKNFNSCGYVPSFDCEEFYETRNKITKLIIQDKNFEQVSGNLQDTSSFIDNKFMLQLKRKG